MRATWASVTEAGPDSDGGPAKGRVDSHAPNRRRASNADFWRICLAMGLSNVGRSMLGTSAPLLAVALGLAPFSVGALVALPNALPVFLGVMAGHWAGRRGTVTWMVGGVAGMSSAPLLVVLAPDVPGLAAAQLLMGLTQLSASLASQSLVADVGSGASPERDYATYAILLSSGRLVGPLLVGLLIDVSGFRPALAVAAAISMLGVALVAGMALRSSGRGRAIDTATGGMDARSRKDADADGDRFGDGSRSNPSARTAFGVREAWASIGVQLAVLSSAGIFVAISVRQAFLPVVLDDLGYPATQIGVLVSVAALASVAVRPFMPFVSRTLRGPARTLVTSLAVASVAVGLLGSVSSFVAFAALSVAAGAATRVALPLSVVTLADRVSAADRGKALGLRLSSNRGAQLAAPMLMGAIVGAAGFAAGFAAVGLALALLAWAIVRRVGKFESHGSNSNGSRPKPG